MNKFKLLLFFIFLSLVGYSQNIIDESRLETLNNLVCMGDVKELRSHKDDLGIYLIRGKNEVEYLVLKYDRKWTAYYFINDLLKKFESLRKLNDEDKLELIYIKPQY